MDSIWTITYTSIAEKSVVDNRIVVYPNPAKDEFNVSFTENLSEPLGIKVFDVLGNQLVYTETLNNKSQPYTIDCKNWSNGIYYLKIVFGNIVSVKRIVKY